MSTFLVSEIIERAADAADMHDNFVDNPIWLRWFNVEYKMLVNRLVKLGMPWQVSSQTITADGSLFYSLNAEPLAIVAIYRKDSSGRLYKLKYRHFSNKRQYSAASTGDATEFYYNKTTAGVDLYMYPTPTSGDYVVDAIYPPTDVASVSESISLPMSWEERVVLGMARRALAKEETVNPVITEQIREIDSHIESSAYDYLMAQQNTVLKIYPDDPYDGYIFI